MAGSRHQLPHENHSTPPLAGVIPATHVESEIHLVEIPMPRNGDSQDTGVEEPKPDQAGERGSVEVVELGSRRHERAQQLSEVLRN